MQQQQGLQPLPPCPARQINDEIMRLQRAVKSRPVMGQWNKGKPIAYAITREQREAHVAAKKEANTADRGRKRKALCAAYEASKMSLTDVKLYVGVEE